jgi:hypothetical protein
MTYADVLLENILEDLADLDDWLGSTCDLH